MNAGDVIQRFANVRKTRRGWSARCPAHADRANSLSIAVGDDRRVLVNCFAGCSTSAIVQAVGLKLRDLFGESSSRKHVSDLPRAPRSSSLLEDARREVIREARRQLARLPLEDYQWADEIRQCHQIVQKARAVATQMGIESSHAWDLLERGAELECMTMKAEAMA